MSPRDPQLNQEMRAQSRTVLMQTAQKLFASKGYFNCRVSDIAQEAGMSTGNIYWYFDSKEALLKAVLKAGFDSLGEIFDRAAGSRQRAIDKLRQVIIETITFGRQMGDFNTLLLSLIGPGGEDLLKEVGLSTEAIGTQYTKSIVTILGQAQAEGNLEGKQDPWFLSMLFFGLFNGLNLTYDQQWLDQPEEEIIAGAMRLLNIQLS